MLEFLWTDDSEAHIARHGAASEEVEQATERPFYTIPGRAGTTLLLGQAHSGRYLLVVLSGSGRGRWHVVTARAMTEAERRVFENKATSL